MDYVYIVTPLLSFLSIDKSKSVELGNVSIDEMVEVFESNE